MTFDILQHLDQLEPDGGTNNPRGDHSFKCPHCGAPNFKVNVVTGKWFTYGCDCASTEEGKRAIREALSPARPPGQDRPLNLQPNRPAKRPCASKRSGPGNTGARTGKSSFAFTAPMTARGTASSGRPLGLEPLRQRICGA